MEDSLPMPSKQSILREALEESFTKRFRLIQPRDMAGLINYEQLHVIIVFKPMAVQRCAPVDKVVVANNHRHWVRVFPPFFNEVPRRHTIQAHGRCLACLGIEVGTTASHQRPAINPVQVGGSKQQAPALTLLPGRKLFSIQALAFKLRLHFRPILQPITKGIEKVKGTVVIDSPVLDQRLV